MLTKEIKYNLSTDYKRLYELLKSGNGVVGFICSFIAAREKTSIDDLVSFGFYITNGNYKNLCNSVTCTVSDFIIR